MRKPNTFLEEFDSRPLLFQNQVRFGFNAQEKIDELWDYIVDHWEQNFPTQSETDFSFERLTGRKWNWLWTSYLYRFSQADLALQEVVVKDSKISLKVHKKGVVPVPIHLYIHFEDGTIKKIHQNATVWDDTTIWTFSAKFKKNIVKVCLGDENIPDAFSHDNIYVVCE
jgi:hypothetical protein